MLWEVFPAGQPPGGQIGRDQSEEEKYADQTNRLADLSGSKRMAGNEGRVQFPLGSLLRLEDALQLFERSLALHH